MLEAFLSLYGSHDGGGTFMRWKHLPILMGLKYFKNTKIN